MAQFTYKATDAAGKIFRGVLEAPDEKAAAAVLQDKGYIPIRLTIAGIEHGRLAWLTPLNTLFRRISIRDLMTFTQDLSALLEAGLPVDRSLEVLKETGESEPLREVIRDLLLRVQGGSYLSDALGQHPKAFSEFYVNMVRAGEAGGVLETVLQRLGMFLQSSQELRAYITSALIYPVFLLAVGGISMIILMTFVIPKFAIIFSDMKGALPISTRILLAASVGFRNYWWLMGLALLALGAWFWRWVRTPDGRLRMDQFKMRAPVVGETVKKIAVARFARTLSTLVGSGVPILQALLLVRDILGNRVISAAMDRVHARVKEGERLSRPLADADIFPAMAIQMITVGEETGRLDEMLSRVADNYEKLVRDAIRRLINLLEPVMILVMGLVVGFIVISMLMAIFSMNDIPF